MGAYENTVSVNILFLLMSQALCHPLWEGWLLMHWAYGGVQRQKHRLDVDDEIFIDWTQVWSMKTLNFGSKRLYKNEHIIEQ